MKPSIYSLTRQTMQEWVLEQGEKKFRADQIYRSIYTNWCLIYVFS